MKMILNNFSFTFLGLDIGAHGFGYVFYRLLECHKNNSNCQPKVQGDFCQPSQHRLPYSSVNNSANVIAVNRNCKCHSHEQHMVA